MGCMQCYECNEFIEGDVFAYCSECEIEVAKTITTLNARIAELQAYMNGCTICCDFATDAINRRV